MLLLCSALPCAALAPRRLRPAGKGSVGCALLVPPVAQSLLPVPGGSFGFLGVTWETVGWKLHGGLLSPKLRLLAPRMGSQGAKRWGPFGCHVLG